jgi:hypothetical protein
MGTLITSALGFMQMKVFQVPTPKSVSSKILHGALEENMNKAR